MDDNNENRFGRYWKYIDDCVSSVQGEMALRNIEDEESLMQCIESRSELLGTMAAFEFFNQSPYEWSDYLTPDLLKLHKNDLGMIALAITNQVVSHDVFAKLSETDGYRFLVEEKKTKTIDWMINGQKTTIKLKEYWASRAAIFDHLPPFEITQIDGNELTIYRDGDELAFILTHDDSSLVWRSKRYSTKADLSVDDYESKKAETLRKYGIPESRLWLTEVQTVDQFYEHYCTEAELEEDYYSLKEKEFEYVVYYHESGEVHVHAGFNDKEEFEQACQTVAEYLKN